MSNSMLQKYMENASGNKKRIGSTCKDCRLQNLNANVYTCKTKELKLDFNI